MKHTYKNQTLFHFLIQTGKVQKKEGSGGFRLGNGKGRVGGVALLNEMARF